MRPTQIIAVLSRLGLLDQARQVLILQYSGKYVLIFNYITVSAKNKEFPKKFKSFPLRVMKMLAILLNVFLL